MAHHLLYGGTFDPIHHGHLICCLRAREALHADSVILLPARLSPHKTDSPPSTPQATPAQRLAMLGLAIDNQPGFLIDDRELSRPGPSYTFDTVSEIVREQPTHRLTLLIGSDQLPQLHTWHRIAELLALIEVAILPRPPGIGTTSIHDIHDLVRAYTANRLRILHTPMIDISATDIRQRAATGLPLTYLVPPAVAAYIEAHRLYRH